MPSTRAAEIIRSVIMKSRPIDGAYFCPFCGQTAKAYVPPLDGKGIMLDCESCQAHVRAMET